MKVTMEFAIINSRFAFTPSSQDFVHARLTHHHMEVATLIRTYHGQAVASTDNNDNGHLAHEAELFRVE